MVVLQDKFKKIKGTLAAGVAAGALTIASTTVHSGVQDGNVYYADSHADGLAYSLKHCNEPMIATNIDKNSRGFESLVFQAGRLEGDDDTVASVVHYNDRLEGEASIFFCGHEGAETPYTDDLTINSRKGYASHIEDHEYDTSRYVKSLRSSSQRGDQEQVNYVLSKLSDQFGASVVPAMVEFIKSKQQASVTSSEPAATKADCVNTVNHTP